MTKADPITIRTNFLSPGGIWNEYSMCHVRARAAKKEYFLCNKCYQHQHDEMAKPYKCVKSSIVLYVLSRLS